MYFQDSQGIYVPPLDDVIQGGKGFANTLPKVVADATKGEVGTGVIKDCLRAGVQRLDAHSKGKGVVTREDGLIMG